MSKNMRNALILIVLIAAVVVVAWILLSSDDDEGDNPPQVETTLLVVSGSGGTTAILEAVKPAFEADTPGYQLEMLTGTGTGGGVKGVIDGTLDVAAMARPPKDDEAIEYLDFGKSGQALYVHESVGDIELTSEQASAIVFGEITNWSEVGGADMEIVLYVRDEGDSTTKALRSEVLGDIEFSETAQVMTSQSDMISAIENTPGAVGMCTWPAAAAIGAKVNSLALDGVSPSDLAYPVTTSMGIGYLAEHETDVQILLDWLVSEEGQAALRDVDMLIS